LAFPPQSTVARLSPDIGISAGQRLDIKGVCLRRECQRRCVTVCVLCVDNGRQFYKSGIPWQWEESPHLSLCKDLLNETNRKGLHVWWWERTKLPFALSLLSSAYSINQIKVDFKNQLLLKWKIKQYWKYKEKCKNPFIHTY
jgi:hypothetical protein